MNITGWVGGKEAGKASAIYSLEYNSNLDGEVGICFKVYKLKLQTRRQKGS